MTAAGSPLGIIAGLGELPVAIASHAVESGRGVYVLRLKGFVALDGADARLVVQAVGPRLSAYFDRPWAGGEERTSSLVVIGEKGLDSAAITARLAG